MGTATKRPTLVRSTGDGPRSLPKVRGERQFEEHARIEGLQARVLALDVDAETTICRTVLPEVRRLVRLARPSEDAHAIDTAAEDAVLIYMRAPQAYDSSRGGLVPWLAKIAVNRLTDFQRSTRRRMAHERAVGVDLSRMAEAAAPEGSGEQREDWIARRVSVLAAVARTPNERRLIEARLANTAHEAQAQALGIAHLPPPQARMVVNRTWELLCRRARRAWHHLEHQTPGRR